MIYFIQDTKSDAIKIGVSRDPVRRLAELQGAHASRLRLLAIMEGTVVDEQALHQLFTRRRGEWFEPTRDLMAYIREHTVSIAALSAIGRTRTIAAPSVALWAPDLRGHSYIHAVARLAVHRQWGRGDLPAIMDIVYGDDDGATLHPRMTRQAACCEVLHLIAVQNDYQPSRPAPANGW